MLPLTRDELQDFEEFCDAEEMSLSERETVIRDAFGPEAAAAYMTSRGQVRAFGSGPRFELAFGLLRRPSRDRRQRPFRGSGRN